MFTEESFMRRFIVSIAFVAAALIVLFAASASAAEESITTKNLTVKTDRLFEVNVGFKSSRTITAARFTLKYNKNDIAIRQAVCNLSQAKVRYNDSNGKTDVIFVYSSGVRCSEFSTLFSVKYKKMNDNNTDISITASDCVDKNLKSFTPPKSAVCKVKGVAGSSSSASSAGKSKKGSSASGKSAYSGKSKSSSASDNDKLETSGKSSSSVADDSEDVKFDGENDPWYLQTIPIIFLIILVAFFTIMLYQNIQLKKAEKRKKEEENKDSDKE